MKTLTKLCLLAAACTMLAAPTVPAAPTDEPDADAPAVPSKITAVTVYADRARVTRTALNVPFLLDLGFSRTEIGLATKGVGMACLIGGGLVGGLLMARWSLIRSLWFFGVLQMVSMSGHLALALVGRNHALLLLTIAVENSIFAMGTVAYLALIQRCCDLKSTATQFALLSSLSAFARVLFASPAGVLAVGVGWPAYFGTCMALAVPGLLLLRRYDGWELPEAAAD